MSRYIDENARIADDIHNAYEEGYADGKRDAVVHGKWVEKTGVLNDATFWWYECSECGERPLKYYGSDCLSRFCPNCGVKMDEVTE